ncbi:putative F-box protein At5g55150 [Macadamia integrifolia]|uniref:putative F-box protein At5g55150 n=1 Tax=Macadamia integrifolia TaxID=60698 RepID=UPI001C4EEBC8|nr:putative F-box protein At5g55150 [Macadamia integrifolia]XP_042504677.1 putative F-box protein At5g55150 [Macadamia integrifolia]
MGIFSEWGKLAFLRMGDEVWTHVCTPKAGFHDIVYLNGQFYAFSRKGKLVMVDISCPDPKTIEIAGLPEGRNAAGQFYLVESVGELFMLARSVYMGYVGYYEGDEDEDESYIYETNEFEVYKFNFDNMNWTLVKNLDNRAIFVGVNASFAIFPSNHSGCEPNCIYFTDDNSYGLMKDSRLEGGAGKDMGVFRMETGKVDYHYKVPDMLSRICAPLWICPSP